MREQIIGILTSLRPEFDFTEDVNFVEAGMLDSFDIITLVDAIETEFGVVISGSDILPDNFCSINAIANIIEHNKNKKGC